MTQRGKSVSVFRGRPRLRRFARMDVLVRDRYGSEIRRYEFNLSAVRGPDPLVCSLMIPTGREDQFQYRVDFELSE